MLQNGDYNVLLTYTRMLKSIYTLVVRWQLQLRGWTDRFITQPSLSVAACALELACGTRNYRRGHSSYHWYTPGKGVNAEPWSSLVQALRQCPWKRVYKPLHLSGQYHSLQFAVQVDSKKTTAAMYKLVRQVILNSSYLLYFLVSYVILELRF